MAKKQYEVGTVNSYNWYDQYCSCVKKINPGFAGQVAYPVLNNPMIFPRTSRKDRHVGLNEVDFIIIIKLSFNPKYDLSCLTD
jgi:hypothetical protein